MDIEKQVKSFIKKSKKPLIVVLGPTAAGKTAFSIYLAGKIDGEVISADSRQLYKGMEIGTAAVTKKEMKGIPHHLLGIVTPDKPITSAEYKDLATQKIDEIISRGKVPMLVGGTGLYISSVILNYDIPRVPPDMKFRIKLEKEALKYGKEFVYARLKKLDPQTKTDPHNLRYVIRALEILKNNAVVKKGKPQYDIFIVGINLPREELYRRIDARVDSQLKNGLMQEVKKLLDHGYDDQLPAMSSLGVKEIIPYLKGEMSIEECSEILKRGTRRYAKRQMTWFRRYDNVHWL